MSYAVMPLADYKNFCDKVREKTNATEAIKSGDMTGKVDEVYKAGQLSVFSSSEALRGKAEGNPISITDVSPIGHDVSVKVSGDALTDFSGVKVTASGKNLFDVSKVKNSQYLTNNVDGTLTVSGAYGVGTGRTLAELCPSLKVGDEVSLRMKTEGNPTLYLNISKFTWHSGASHIITEDDLNSFVTVYGMLDKGTYTISNIMVHYYTGSVLPFEPYVGHTEYTTNADGTVKGVKSIYPSMSISAEGSVTISAEYYKDIDKVLENLAINTALSGGE